MIGLRRSALQAGAPGVGRLHRLVAHDGEDLVLHALDALLDIAVLDGISLLAPAVH